MLELEYIRTLEICPITTSNYCGIAEGYNTTEFIKINNSSWRVVNRGELQTIRFDNSTLQTLDYKNSVGIIGHRFHQNSLYVYLDESIEDPQISLKSKDQVSTNPTRPYLNDSRWKISNLTYGKDGIEFNTQGFGDAHMVWLVPEPGEYDLYINNKSIGQYKSAGNKLEISFKYDAITECKVQIKKIITTTE